MALISSLCIFVLVAHFATPIVCHKRLHQAALFAFGDSIFDPGNNKYINPNTSSQGVNNFPYGESFFKYPTGRASDGRLIPDFIAEYANLPLIPPYFEIGKEHFIHGVNFASGGSGCLAETSRGFAIDLKTQLKLFQNVTQLLKNKVGEIESKQILSNAVYIFSTASNDFLFPLLANLTSPYSDTEYLHMVMGNLTSVLKGVYKEGGRKFVMFNLGPLGCIPSIRALNLQKGVTNGSCMDEATNKAKMFNLALPRMFKQLEKQLPGFKYTIFNFSKVLADSINNPTKYGIGGKYSIIFNQMSQFENWYEIAFVKERITTNVGLPGANLDLVHKSYIGFKISETACCGTGPFRGILSCGGTMQVKEYELCKNVKEYLFFDSVHPTELAYQQYTKLLWNGTPDMVAPYKLKSFFKLST